MNCCDCWLPWKVLFIGLLLGYRFCVNVTEVLNMWEISTTTFSGSRTLKMEVTRTPKGCPYTRDAKKKSKISIETGFLTKFFTVFILDMSFDMNSHSCHTILFNLNTYFSRDVPVLRVQQMGRHEYARNCTKTRCAPFSETKYSGTDLQEQCPSYIERDNQMEQKQTPWSERTIPTERPPIVGEVSAKFCG
jgi:hypothetical protein